MAIDFKKNFIIINYPTGAFGSFLSHCLYKSGKVYNLKTTEQIFDSKGAAHKGHAFVIDKFHGQMEISSWSKKDKSSKIKYLHDNLTVDIDPTTYYLLRITSPEHTNHFYEIFDIKKIFEIRVDESMSMILENLILDKIYSTHTLKELTGFPYPEKLKPLFIKKTVKYFVEHSKDKKGDRVVDFRDFFLWETFFKRFQEIQRSLGFDIDESVIRSLYDSFEESNAKYFSFYHSNKKY